MQWGEREMANTCQHSFKDDTSVVVKPSSKTEVKRDLAKNTNTITLLCHMQAAVVTFSMAPIVSQ